MVANRSLGTRRATTLSGLQNGNLPNHGVNLNQNLSSAIGSNIVSSPKVYNNTVAAFSFGLTEYKAQLLAISRMSSPSTGSVMIGYTGRSVLYKDVTLNMFLRKDAESRTSTALGYKPDASCAHRIMVVQFHKPNGAQSLPIEPSTFLTANVLGNYWALYRTDTADHYTVWLDRHIDINDRYMTYVETIRNCSKPRAIMVNVYLQFNTVVDYSSSDLNTAAPGNVTDNAFYLFIFHAYSGYHIDGSIPKTKFQMIETSQYYDN